MRLCLDTNVLIRLFIPHPPFSEILDAILNGQITILLSNDILLEYEEVVIREFGQRRWAKIQAFLAVMSNLHHNVLEIDPHFRFRVIADDADDNKFADCAIVGEADFIVTYDTHFAALRSAGYKPKPITPENLVTSTAFKSL
jgi:putative PIN family toxin of toxin-antitoxin system